jgi:hypothetical protein
MGIFFQSQRIIMKKVSLYYSKMSKHKNPCVNKKNASIYYSRLFIDGHSRALSHESARQEHFYALSIHIFMHALSQRTLPLRACTKRHSCDVSGALRRPPIEGPEKTPIVTKR